MRHYRNIVPVLFLASVLAACGGSQSRVQNRYTEAQEICRDTAEAGVARMPNLAALTPDQQSMELVNQFSQCMKKTGWPVSNPLERKGGKPTEEAGAGVPPTAVNAAAKAAAPPAPTEKTIPNPARYQPAPNAPATVPEAKPGRQF